MLRSLRLVKPRMSANTMVPVVVFPPVLISSDRFIFSTTFGGRKRDSCSVIRDLASTSTSRSAFSIAMAIWLAMVWNSEMSLLVILPPILDLESTWRMP